jgi:Putative transposase/Transposase zinc-binding domain
VRSAIEQCRSAALGGHVERCQDCGHSRIAYNSCRNRHCPKCQGAAAKDSRLFRRRFRAALADAHAAGRLAFIGEIEGLRRRKAFAAHLAPLKRKNWFVYAKPPFAGPQAVLAYLARYTHRVAIANSRLVALDERGVTFRYKDYRRNRQARYRTMTLSADEFIRRFLLHVLPKGFHRIRHYGLLASAGCKANIARAKELIAAPMPEVDPPAAHDTADPGATTDHRPPCPCCGGRMLIVEVFARCGAPRGPPSSSAGTRI